VFGVGIFVWQSSTSADNATSTSQVDSEAGVSGPLDSIAAAEIATSVAYAVDLPQSGAVNERAITFAYQSNFAIDEDISLAKPQIVEGGSQSKSDIVSYTVVDGDSVSSLATKFNVTSDSIKWSNGLSSDSLAVGRVINIPPANRNGIVYTVKAGDTAESLASKYKTTADRIISFNDAEVSGLAVGDKIFIPDGKIEAAPVYSGSSSFSYSGSGFGAAIFGGNGYTPGQCTYGAAGKRAEIGRPIPSNWGSAFSWDEAARAQGYRVDRSPEIGSVIQAEGGEGWVWIYHVGVVVDVDAEFVYVYDMNYAGPWSVRIHKIPMDIALRHDFIH
jgi:surface antigen/LysM repeat protein